MKKTTRAGLIICAIAIMIFMITGCTSTKKEPEVAAVMKTIRGEIDLPDMAEIASDALEVNIGIKSADMVEFGYIAAGSGATADEIFIGKVADGVKTSDVIAKFESRKTMQADLFKDYNPDEMDKINSAVIKENGNYVFFAMCNDNKKAEKIFNESF